MRVKRKDNGVEWDVHPSYYENYKNEFIVLDIYEIEPLPQVPEDVDIQEYIPPVKKKGGRPPKEKS